MNPMKPVKPTQPEPPPTARASLHPHARGPVATLYTAVVSGKPVALKVFPAKFDRRTLAAVERDRAKLATVAASAPILPVDSIGVREGRHALRMELCPESLATRVRRAGALTPQDVVVLGHALARALRAAHGVGVLHGGVSPDNVLFRTSGEPVLADFGVPLREAFPRDPLHAIECVPPETLRTGVVTEQTDLYGLGAVLHFALTGQSPHPGRLGEQPGDRVLRVLRSPVPAISRADVPVELSTVVARLLAADPDHRPRDAAWVVDRLAAMLPHPPATSTTPPEPAPVTHPDVPTPQHRSRRRYLAGGGVALACLLTVALGFALRGTPPQPTTPPPSPTPTGTGLELAEPDDLGDHVVLNWTGADGLDFVVVVAGDGEPHRYLIAERNRTMRVPVEPTRKYCFQIRATDSDRVYMSAPKPVRGAICPNDSATGPAGQVG